MSLCRTHTLEAPTAIDATMVEAFYVATFPSFVNFVKRNGGSLEDAEDVFQDALVAIFEKEWQQVENPHAYLMSIGKYLWYRKYKKESRVQLLDSMPEMIVALEDFYPSKAEFRLMKVLEKAGKRCLDLLQSFYYKEWKLEEITTRLGFRNKHHASVQKHKCLEKVKSIVHQKSYTYEDFR